MITFAPSSTEESYSSRVHKWVKQRNRAKYIAVAQFFLFGAEFSMVTPTLPFYLKELNASNIPLFVGIIVCAYCISASLSSLVFGRIVDVTLRYKAVVISANIIALFGNVTYVIGYSPYLLIIARLLTGVLDAIYSATYGELARCYTAREFPRHGGHLMTAFCFGLSISPGFNLMPSDAMLDMGFLTIRYTNAPGVILLFLGFTQVIVCSLFLSNLSLNKQRYQLNVDVLFEEQQNTLPLQNGKVSYKALNGTQADCDESKITVTEEVIVVSERKWWIIIKDLITRKEIVVLLYGQGIWAYSLITGVVLIPLVAINYLQFNHFQVALFYIASGIVGFIVMFVSSKLISRYGSVYTSLAAFIINLTGTLFLYLLVLADELSLPIKATFFTIFGMAYFLAWFLNSVSLKSTLSKHAAMEDQSFAQGLFTTAEQCASIIASLTSGLSYTIITWYCVWSIGLLLLAIFVFSLFYQDLEYSSLSPVNNK